MIAIHCPHCQVGLKIDEQKIPAHLETFNCPKCKQPIPIKLVQASAPAKIDSAETQLLQSGCKQTGRLEVEVNPDTPAQVICLHEGDQLIGRRSCQADHSEFIGINTSDRSMSRTHLRIQVQKDAKNGYKHYLSDNNSKNNTLYNGNYLEKEEVGVLNDGDEIVI